jgi:hypothetical protein
MGLLKLFKKKTKDFASNANKPLNGFTDTSSVSLPAKTANSNTASFSNQTDDDTIIQPASIIPEPSQKNSRRSSFAGILRKPSFNHDTSIQHLENSNNTFKNVSDLPEELLPVVTLINHQQSRCYYKGNSFYYDSTGNLNSLNSSPIESNFNTSTSFNWIAAYLELNGNDITVETENLPSTIINICDCELFYNKQEIMLTVTITNNSIMYFQFDTLEELDVFYSSILLCKFEYQQLQEAYTGALLSSQAIHFSDIRTLLSPNNKNIKEEWCVIRFPFLNDKWIRCLVVIKPNNKMEIYTNSNKSKKYLLSTITNGLNCYTIYPNDPLQIQNNSLLRLNGLCYINSELLNIILNDETMSSITNESIRSKKNMKTSSTRSRTNSLNKRISINSLRSKKSFDSNLSNPNDNNSNFSRTNNTTQSHQRVSSIDTTVSESSFSNFKTPKKLSKKELVKTHLIYIIPESHASVKPCEIMLRMLIPILNTFSLYGRPTKFISSRTEKKSLLFGLPQLPNTYYLNNKSCLDLINLNIDNSIKEDWTANDWNLIFKELMSALMEKGWKGGSYQGDLANLNVSLNMDRNLVQTPDYDPMEDFIDRASSGANRSTSMSFSLVDA